MAAAVAALLHPLLLLPRPAPAASSCRWWCGQQQKRQQEGRRRGRLREGRMLTSRYPVYSGRSRRLWQERQRRLSSGARQMHRSSLLQWRLLLLLLLRPWRAFRCSAVQTARTACPSCQSSHSCRRRLCSSRPRWCQPQQPSLPSPQRRQPARQQPPQQQPLLRRKCPAQVRFIIPGLQCLNMHSPCTVQIPCWSAQFVHPQLPTPALATATITFLCRRGV